MATLGYAHEGDLGIAGREAFRSPPGEMQHPLYVVEPDAPELRRHLAFRGALRKDPALCKLYAELKRSLICQNPSREAYSGGKSSFVEAVLSASTGRYLLVQ